MVNQYCQLDSKMALKSNFAPTRVMRNLLIESDVGCRLWAILTLRDKLHGMEPTSLSVPQQLYVTTASIVCSAPMPYDISTSLLCTVLSS